MKIKYILSFLFIGFSIMLFTNNHQNNAPTEVLFDNPHRANAQISPDGLHLSFLQPDSRNILNIRVQPLEKDIKKNHSIDDDAGIQITNDTNKGIRSYQWAQDSEQVLYVQDTNGDENHRLYLTNIHTKETVNLTPFDNITVQILAHESTNPNIAIIGMNKDNPELHDVYSVDLLSHKITLIEKNPGNVASWIIDHDLQPKIAVVNNDNDGSTNILAKQANGEWKQIISWSFDDTGHPAYNKPISLSQDNQLLYLSASQDANCAQLIEYNLITNTIKVLASDNQNDLSNLLVHPQNHIPLAAGFTKDRKKWVFIDQSINDDFSEIEKLHNGDFDITSQSKDNMRWIIVFDQDTGPAAYYLYDRANKTSQFLFYNKPKLLDYELASMHPMSYKTQDNLTIHGYITYPKDHQNKKVPLVLLVHGGPWHRDTWGYDPQAQWCANLGYACLQVNFRGSTGYGKEFLNAGNKQWSLKMHDDLIDAVNWAKSTGYINPDKIAIFGGSYGGYAALVGATFTPDLFCCAVDIVGPSNLISLINSLPPYWKPINSLFTKRVGDPKTEEEFLKSCSPLFKVDQIKIPILIAQGKNDPRVKEQEADQIVEAMKERGIPYQYELYEDEGHGFAKPHNRLDFYSKAEIFLKRHLG